MLDVRPTVVMLTVAAALVAGGRLRAATLAERLAAEGPRALAAAAPGSGDAARGAVVFHTAHLTCTKCHVAGEGDSPLGPDLVGPRVGPDGPLSGTALTEHLVEAILDPSRSIRPEYRAVTILTTEGQTVSVSLDDLVSTKKDDASTLPSWASATELTFGWSRTYLEDGKEVPFGSDNQQHNGRREPREFKNLRWEGGSDTSASVVPGSTATPAPGELDATIQSEIKKSL